MAVLFLKSPFFYFSSARFLKVLQNYKEPAVNNAFEHILAAAQVMSCLQYIDPSMNPMRKKSLFSGELTSRRLVDNLHKNLWV